MAAQIVAFACGKEDENKNKNFEGGRPSSIIIGDQVNPASLGALLAHFENKIMFQGLLMEFKQLRSGRCPAWKSTCKESTCT